MKELKDFINESKETDNVFNSLFAFYFDEADDQKFVTDATKLIKTFLKDNNIKLVDDVKIESSEDALYYMEDIYDNVEESTDDNFIEAASNGFTSDGDAWCEDFSSWRYDKKNKTLYMSSQTGASMNGDYFDAKFTKA